MDGGSILLIVAALVGAGGLAGAVVALFKVKPERESIIVSAAQGAVVIQSGVIDDLSDQLAEARRRLHELETEARQNAAALRAELQEVRRERNRYREERDRALANEAELRERVEALEAEVAELRRTTPTGGGSTLPPSTERSGDA